METLCVNVHAYRKTPKIRESTIALAWHAFTGNVHERRPSKVRPTAMKPADH